MSLPAVKSAGSASAHFLQGSAGRKAIALRAMRAAETHLSEPDLSARRVAKFTGISVRYLQKIFEGTGATPNQFIRLRRLQSVAQDLADPHHASHSITEISLRWGFADYAYFSRAFKSSYGISPLQYRNTAVKRAGGTTAA